MNSSVIVIASFTPKDGAEHEVEKILQGMVSPSRGEAGCTCYDLYQKEASTSFTLFESYKNQAALEEHRQTEHFKNYRAQIIELLKEPIQVNILQEINAAKR